MFLFSVCVQLKASNEPYTQSDLPGIYHVVTHSMEDAVLQVEAQIQHDPNAYIFNCFLVAPRERDKLIVVDHANL